MNYCAIYHSQPAEAVLIADGFNCKEQRNLRISQNGEFVRGVDVSKHLKDIIPSFEEAVSIHGF